MDSSFKRFSGNVRYYIHNMRRKFWVRPLVYSSGGAFLAETCFDEDVAEFGTHHYYVPMYETKPNRFGCGLVHDGHGS